MSFFDKIRHQKFLSFTLILFTLSAGVVIGTLVNTTVNAAKDNNTSAVAPGATPLVVPNVGTAPQSEFAILAKAVEPSVVNISTQYLPKRQQTTQNQPNFRNRRRSPMPDDDDNDGPGGGGNGGSGGMDDFLYRFFGGNPFGGQGGGPDSHGGAALGSGVVVDRAGYVLTNNHVVDKADRIKVKFNNDAREYDAKVIGTDAATDLAVIHVEGKQNFVPAKIGNSDAVQVGDWSVAIGSPFGFQATVTAGIISAKERDVDPTMQFQHFLQTDAAINPGNSGGPLLNIKGEVIGINTAIASRSGGYQGIGFALPINTAVMVYNQIIKTGKVVRGSIGVRFSADPAQSRELLRAYGNGISEGVFVQSVEPGGPADKAGLKETDIIVAVNGKPIKTGSELVDKVTQTPIGNPVTITVLREGHRQDFKVTVADLSQVFPDQYGSGKDKLKPNEEATQARFGVSIQDLTAEQRRQFNVKETGGVLIQQVEPGSFAEDIGLAPKDILMSINRQPVNSVADVKRIQGTLHAGDAVAFRVLRQGRGQSSWTAVYLAGTMPANQ